MTKHTLDSHIELTPGVLGGKPRIAGTRVAVMDIVIQHEKLGRSVDEIATEHDLGLADVHAALAYYFDHRAEVDQAIGAGRALAERLRSFTPSKIEGEGNGGANPISR